MKIKVNKNQLWDEIEIDNIRRAARQGDSLTYSVDSLFNFVEEDVSFEQLQDYINQGYGIKINC